MAKGSWIIERAEPKRPLTLSAETGMVTTKDTPSTTDAPPRRNPWLPALPEQSTERAPLTRKPLVPALPEPKDAGVRVRKGSRHHNATPRSHVKLHKRRMGFELEIPLP